MTKKKKMKNHNLCQFMSYFKQQHDFTYTQSNNNKLKYQKYQKKNNI